MLTKKQSLSHVKNILDQIYPDTDEINDEFLRVIDLHFAKEISISSEKTVKHKTVKLKHFDGYICDIDKNIADLINLIWQCHIDTYNSCENNVPAGYMWIEFSTSHDIQKFLNIVFVDVNKERGTEIFERATNTLWPHQILDSWQYDIVLNDEHDLQVSVSLRFPREDYDWICKRFREYLENK